MDFKRAGLAVALAAFLPFAAGCGGGSKNAAEPLPSTAPTLTVPGEKSTPKVDNSATDTSTATTGVPTTTSIPASTPTTTTTPAAAATPQGGTAAPQTGGASPDSPQNDTAPPANSPASKFEQFCKENPGAC